jgi:hypothetical protein
MAAQYDSGILQKYADDLYSQAKWIVVSTALGYGLVAFVVIWLALGMVFPITRMRIGASDANSLEIMVAIIAAVIGAAIGRRRTFALKLQAQQILCQREIELNTRRQDKAATATGAKQ